MSRNRMRASRSGTQCACLKRFIMDALPAGGERDGSLRQHGKKSGASEPRLCAAVAACGTGDGIGQGLDGGSRVHLGLALPGLGARLPGGVKMPVFETECGAEQQGAARRREGLLSEGRWSGEKEKEGGSKAAVRVLNRKNAVLCVCVCVCLCHLPLSLHRRLEREEWWRGQGPYPTPAAFVVLVEELLAAGLARGKLLQARERRLALLRGGDGRRWRGERGGEKRERESCQVKHTLSPCLVHTLTIFFLQLFGFVFEGSKHHHLHRCFWIPFSESIVCSDQSSEVFHFCLYPDIVIQ